MSDKRKPIFATTLSVTLVIFLSKALGFIRDVIEAGYFGTGIERAAYAAAYGLFYIPVLLFNSCITSTLIPLYMDARGRDGRMEAHRFASNCINLFAVFSLVVGLLMLILAEPLVHLVYQGFDIEKRLLIVQLTRIMMPSLVFVVVSIVMASILNANERFITAQLTGFPLTVAVVLATVLFAPKYGIVAVAWGVFAAGILQMLILVPSLGRVMRYRFHVRSGDERFKRMLILALPSMLSMAVNELNHMVDKSVCAFLGEDAFSALDYAFRLITFATGVLAVPITTIMFSRLSRRASDGDRKGLTEILNQSVEVLTMIQLPFLVIGSVLATDIIRLAYGHGRFGAESVAITSGIFVYYLIGIVGFALRDVYTRAFHAIKDTRTPMFIAMITVALNIVLILILSRVMGVNGLALATTISCGLGAVILMIVLRRRLKRVGFTRMVPQLLKMGAAALVCLGVALALHAVIPEAQNKLTVFARLVAITGAGMGAYLGVLIALKVDQLSFLKTLLHRRKA